MRNREKLALLLTVGVSTCMGPAIAGDHGFSCREPEPVIAFTNIRLVPMTHDQAVAGQTVVICGGQIGAIGPGVTLRPPEGATVIDGQGAFLSPGLGDMHLHVRNNWLDGSWPVSPFSLLLANGVTTIRHFGGAGPGPQRALIWRDEIAKGVLPGPRLLVGARVGHEPIKDISGFIKQKGVEGYDFIKLYSFLSREEFGVAIRASEQAGLRTVGHIPFAVGLEQALTAGMDEVAHIEELDFEFLAFDRGGRLPPRQWFEMLVRLGSKQMSEFETDSGLDVQRFLRVYRQKITRVIGRVHEAGIPVSTTLTVGRTIVAKHWRPAQFLARPENRYLPDAYWDRFNKGQEKHLRLFRGHERFARSKYALETMLLKRLAAAGVPLLLASDAGTASMGIVPGFSIHDELGILVDNGFTVYQALLTGTANASKAVARMTGSDSFGTIEVGKRADLILVANNPLKDVSHLRDPIGVMAAGRWYPRTRLRQMIELK